VKAKWRFKCLSTIRSKVGWRVARSSFISRRRSVADAPITQGRRLRLSAVIACYKDAEAVPHMHRRLTEVFSALDVDYEIIFVNDGSPDDTDRVLATLTASDDHVIAVEHSRNFGAQNAFLSGMELTTGDGVVLLDGDLQDPPEVIPALFEKWRQGNDVVYARRAKRAGSVLMSVCYKAFYRVFRRMSDVPMPLDAGDFSLMDRKVVDALVAFPETDPFLRGLRAWVGFRQTGVDSDRPERAFGRSNNNLLKNIAWAKKGIFSFSVLPIEILGYAGATLAALSFLALAYQLIDVLRRPQIAHGVPVIITLILLFGGVNLVAISILGEYVTRILDVSRQRPRFIRKAIRHAGRYLSSANELEGFLRTKSR